MPKQLLPLIEGQSLLQLAYDRARALVDPERILVCAGRAYKDVIASQLPELVGGNLLLEPTGRDSLPAVAWSMATIAQRDPDAVVATLTAAYMTVPGLRPGYTRLKQARHARD
jgi:mannose-1-phosphate guanylyltransferase